jgi:hypothetical protein
MDRGTRPPGSRVACRRPSVGFGRQHISTKTTIYKLTRHHVAPWFSEEFKTCQVNAFHLNSNQKFSNNLIGCISWHAYFYFWALGRFRFLKRFTFRFKIFFLINLKVFRLKTWFKFDYRGPKALAVHGEWTESMPLFTFKNNLISRKSQEVYTELLSFPQIRI